MDTMLQKSAHLRQGGIFVAVESTIITAEDAADAEKSKFQHFFLGDLGVLGGRVITIDHGLKCKTLRGWPTQRRSCGSLSLKGNI